MEDYLYHYHLRGYRLIHVNTLSVWVPRNTIIFVIFVWFLDEGLFAALVSFQLVMPFLNSWLNVSQSQQIRDKISWCDYEKQTQRWYMR